MPWLARMNTFSPGEKGRMTAIIIPPMKFAMRSFAARPRVKPPMPPNPIRLDAGSPKESAVTMMVEKTTPKSRVVAR